MIVVDPPGDPALRIVGVVRGLVADVVPARDAVAGFRPDALGLGISTEELEALRVHFLEGGVEPVVPLGPTEVAEAKALVKFGEVGVPHPVFVDLLGWGRSVGVPVEGLDPDEDVQAELFVAHIGYLELVRRTVRERRAGRRPPEAADANQFALAWDKEVHPGRGSERYAAARERSFVTALRELRTRRARTVIVTDRERVPRLQRILAEGGAS